MGRHTRDSIRVYTPTLNAIIKGKQRADEHSSEALAGPITRHVRLALLDKFVWLGRKSVLKLYILTAPTPG